MFSSSWALLYLYIIASELYEDYWVRKERDSQVFPVVSDHRVFVCVTELT